MRVLLSPTPLPLVTSSISCAAQVHDLEGGTLVSNVSTTYLLALLDQVNIFKSVDGSRMIFDLGGLQMRCVAKNKTPLIITASSVTLRNGSILISDKYDESNTLFVEGTHVVFEDITIKGAETGLSIMPGGSVTMRDCEFDEVRRAVQVGSTEVEARSSTSAGRRASLVAHRVKMVFYTVGLRMEQGAHVQLFDCEINDVLILFGSCRQSKSIQISGPDSCLEAHKVTCMSVSNVPMGGSGSEGSMLCEHGGRAILGCCTITCEPKVLALLVRDKESSVELWYCTFATEPKAELGATLSNKGLVSDLENVFA